jgi:hypothetical protein
MWPRWSIPVTNGEELSLAVYKMCSEHFCKELEEMKDKIQKNGEKNSR